MGGDTVAITGTGFGESAQVFFGSEQVDADAIESSTEIIAISPPEQAGQSTVDVTVDCNGSSSPVVAADQFTYIAGAPSSGPTAPSSSDTTTDS